MDLKERLMYTKDKNRVIISIDAIIRWRVATGEKDD